MQLGSMSVSSRYAFPRPSQLASKTPGLTTTPPPFRCRQASVLSYIRDDACIGNKLLWNVLCHSIIETMNVMALQSLYLRDYIQADVVAVLVHFHAHAVDSPDATLLGQ